MNSHFTEKETLTAFNSIIPTDWELGFSTLKKKDTDIRSKRLI